MAIESFGLLSGIDISSNDIYIIACPEGSVKHAFSPGFGSDRPGGQPDTKPGGRLQYPLEGQELSALRGFLRAALNLGIAYRTLGQVEADGPQVHLLGHLADVTAAQLLPLTVKQCKS